MNLTGFAQFYFCSKSFGDTFLLAASSALRPGLWSFADQQVEQRGDGYLVAVVDNTDGETRHHNLGSAYLLSIGRIGGDTYARTA